MAAATVCFRAALAASLLLVELLSNARAGDAYDFVSKPDGTPVTVTGVVTGAWEGFFYIQQDDRACGIRVVAPGMAQQGDLVEVEGVLGMAGPERAIVATRYTPLSHGLALPEPLRFIVRQLGGATFGYSPGVPGHTDLYNVGLRVRVTGEAETPAGGPGALNAGVTTLLVEPGQQVWPAEGSLAIVTGISSLTGEADAVQALLRATDVRVADITPPETEIVAGPEEGVWLPSPEATFTFSGTDDVSPAAELTFSWQLDEGEWTSFGPDTTASLAALADGPHVFRVRCRDAAENVDETPAVRAFSVDTTPPPPPSVTDEGVTTLFHSQLTASWLATDPESGVVEYVYAIGLTPADPGLGYLVDWKTAGEAAGATETGLSLQDGMVCYWYVRARNGAGLWSDAGASDGITVTSWLPQTVMFVGDSLTQGLFASTEDKTFVSRAMAKLQEAYPGKSFTRQVIFGTDGSPMRTIAQTIKAYNGPWPDVVVVQDAATQSNPMTGGSTDGLAVITADANGRITSARPDALTPGSGYQWKYPGEGSALGVLVTFRQGENTSAGGLATVSPLGVPLSYAVQSGGSGYSAGQPVEVLTDDWLNLATSAIDDILSRWGTPESRPLVVFAALWQQPKAEFELDGVTMSWNDHWARVLSGPDYAGKVFLVPEFAAASYEYWALGWYYRATCDGGSTWVFKYTVPFDPTGKELYLRDGRWSSLITGWDGKRNVTTKEPRGVARTDPELWVNLIQASPWYTTYGDGYHPTDAGHEALGQGVFDAIQQGIAARNAR